MAVQLLNITDEVLDFLVTGPTPKQIIAFHASERAQEQLRLLLERNQSGTLTEQERAEFEEMSRVDHLFTLIKARAMKVLQDGETATQT